ncbi:cardiolipin synthase [Paenibacillus sophorae]|uniref:Cardiolipin synthase n=1 Tax=Paenibacillus sophorae TaxID=1333845 RepID=A0A1H8VMR3_9BACL|nr:cardiolipin synthase [Paenibacillus sophorae]QWU17185.1 cardiolipin synthase [Paenibacillus sophorae]SEP16168.1 cardiolipin synthase [Paenibacillus sophorae]
MKIFAAALCLFILQIIVILVLEYRRPQRAVAWLFLLFCCPPLGLLIYYFLGRDYRQSRKLKAHAAGTRRVLHDYAAERSQLITRMEDTGNPELSSHKELLRLLDGLSESLVTGRNASRILVNAGEAYESMLEAMESASEHIHLEVYIFRNDATGERFQDVMIRKARQGVKVRLLCDGLGSRKLGRRFLRPLASAGVETHFFLPSLASLFGGRFNYRNHRKILIVDGLVGFTGGINIGDEYLGKDPKMGFWRDTHLRLEGDAVYYMQHVFLKDWQLVSGERLSHPRLFPVHGCEGTEGVQIIGSGPDGEIDANQAMIFAAICAAESRIWIASPYFIPDPAILRALKNAVLRGADVRIIIPSKPDSALVYNASLSYLDNLLDAGVKFYRYRKGFMHAKVWIADGLLASVGSVNMDMRSFYTDFELSAVLLQPQRIEELANQFRRDLEDSETVDPYVFRQRGELARATEEICSLLSPLL